MNKENHILCISSMCLKKKKEKERTRKKKEKYPDQKQIANNSLIYLKRIIQKERTIMVPSSANIDHEMPVNSMHESKLSKIL